MVFSILSGFIYRIIHKSSIEALQKDFWKKHFRYLTQNVPVHSHVAYKKKWKSKYFYRESYID